MRSLFHLRWWGLVVFIATLAAVFATARTAVVRAPSSAAPHFDVGDVVARVRFAFRDAEGGFRATSAQQTIDVKAGGFELTPRAERGQRSSRVRFETRSVRRGELNLWSEPGLTRRTLPTKLATRAAGVTEHLESTADGVEQSWTFDALPAATGDLVVTIGVDAPLLAQTNTGLHFGAGELALRYGHGTWVDANGVRTPIEATWREGHVELVVSDALLAASTFPAVLDPLVSAELAIDQPSYLPSQAADTEPAVSWNGTHTLVAFASGGDIVGVRMDPAGTAIDAAGFTIAAPGANRGSPAAGSDGTGWYVAWLDNNGEAQVYGSRVAADGTSQPATLLSSFVSGTWGRDLSVAWGSGSYLVAWTREDTDSNRGIDLADIPASGPITQTTLLSTSTPREYPDVAFDGTSFLVVWIDSTASVNNIRGRRFVPGTLATPDPEFAITTSGLVAGGPSAAWNGNRFLVVWPSNVAQIHSSLVLASPLSVGAVTAVSSNANAKTNPDVAAFGTSGAGTSWLVAWKEGTSEIRGTRVTNTGSVTDATSLLLASGAGGRDFPSLAATASTAWLAWEDTRTTNQDVWARTVSPAAVIGTERLLSARPSTEQAAALAFGASTYLVVWQDDRNGAATDIFGARFDSLGVALDSAAFPISTAVGNQTTPDVAFISGANQFFVTWTDRRDGGSNIVGARVTPGGSVLDPAGLAVCDAVSNQANPAIASNGSSALVVWNDFRNNALTLTDIFFTTVFADAGVSSTVGTPLSTDNAIQQNPAVAWNGTHFLVAWEDQRTPSVSAGDIYAARVSSAGAALDVGGVAISRADGGEGLVSAAAVGDKVLLAWTIVDLAGRRDVVGRIVGTSGNIGPTDGGPSLFFATGPGTETLPAVGGDGTNFLTTWTVTVGDDGGLLNEIRGARVSSIDGGILEPAFVISPSTGGASQGESDSASSGPKAFLVAYNRFDPNTAFNTNRIRARRLSNAPPSATAMSTSTPEDTAKSLQLAGTDGDSDDTLTYVVQTMPTRGTLTGMPPNLVYTPSANTSGADSFTFTVSDGVVTSSAATVNITVTAVNDAPVAQPQTVSTQEDTALPITLQGSDIESDPLTYLIVAGPTNGSLGTVSGASVTYTPSANFNGADAFTFRVRDTSNALSADQTVTITVTPVNDAPVANALMRTTNEDTAVSVTLTGSDVDSASLTSIVVTNPTNGALSGTPPNLTYTPTTNAFGTDVFTFKVNDGTVDSAPAQVTVTVISVNDAPVAQGAALGTPRDTPLLITLQASDVDSSSLTYAVVTNPTNGALSGTGNTRTYTPNTNYAGNDSFTFKANDGQADSNVATITIAVASSNRAPVANPQSVTTPEDTSRAITLTGTDADGDMLTFAIVTQPTQGVITGTSPTYTYQPTSNYSGPDSFTVKANDGMVDSATVTVSITVTAVNDAPIATSTNVAVAEDSTLTFALTGSDAEGSTLTYAVTMQPANGTLSGTPPMLQYQPAANYSGSDALQFTVSDGTLTSLAGTISITVTPVNDPPVAQPQSVSTPQDTPRTITLLGTDIDSSALTFLIVTQPSNGALSGTPPAVTYTPNTNFRGNDTFTFKVNDGAQDSAVVSVGISVAAVNRAPVAAADDLTTAEEQPVAVTLAATDQDGDALAYRVTTMPTKGTLSGTAPNLTYTPNANATGMDSFGFRANDGTLDSNEGTVRLTITPVNDPPVASAQQVTAPEDSAVSIVLTGADPDVLDMFTWTVTAQPQNGTLTGNPPNLTYTPAANYNGPDSLTFQLNDGTVDSAAATVTITVTAVNDAPTASAISESTVESSPVAITLRGTDVESDVLTFAVDTDPAHGTVAGTSPDVTYTPAAGFTGTDTFTYVASDGSATSAPATVTITVSQGQTTDTTRVNGWSCGCSTDASSFAPWALGLFVLATLRRRRAGAAVAMAAALFVAAPSSAFARPAAKKATTTKKATPAPEPVPEPAPVVTPAPTPAPVEPVAAPQPAPAAKLPSLAALDVVVTGEELDAVAFSEMVATAVDQSKLYRVLSSRDIQALLGVERQKALLGCSDDTSCITEIADALGSEFVMQGSVGKVGDTYLVTVRLIDSKKARVVGRGAGQTGDKNLLLSLIWKSTQEAMDKWGATLPPEEARKVAARPQIAPVTAVAPARSKIGVIVALVGGYQPLAPEGSRGTIGGEVAASWRIGRIELGAGVVISPTPGARIYGMVALLEGRHRISVGLRASGFFGPGVYGGGPAVEYELGLGETFGIRVIGAGEAYGSKQGFVLALLGGLGAAARF